MNQFKLVKCGILMKMGDTVMFTAHVMPLATIEKIVVMTLLKLAVNVRLNVSIVVH